MGRTLVIGDVHGCLQELELLLAKASPGPADQVVFCGDLCAKGPDSQGVVQLARERGARAVLGNHDAHMLGIRSGAHARAHHTAVARTLKSADWAWLEALPLMVDLPALGSLVVHGGLVPGVALDQQERRYVLNLRSIDSEGRPSTRVEEGVPWASLWTGPQFVVFGHDALRGLQKHPHALGLDTGCVYGKRLTAVWLPERHLVQVDALKVWQAPDDG